MARLNDDTLRALAEAKEPAVIAVGDGSGLAFRVTSTSATWQLRYRHAGRAHWLTLGHFPTVKLKEAKKRATRERARISEGVDVVADKRRAKLALRAAKTFRELAADYMQRAGPDLAQSSREDRQWFLDRLILPRLGELRLDEIGGGEIVRFIEQIAVVNTPVMARRSYAILSVVFGHGMAKHLVRSNPLAGLKLRAILGSHRPIRTPVALDEQQLRALFAELPAIGAQNALAVKILLATATRRGELIRAKWEHVDLENGLWSIPRENSKNRKAFVIPLPPLVVGWFVELKPLTLGSPWVLVGHNGRDPIGPTTLNAALHRLVDALPRFAVHDLSAPHAHG